MLPIYYFPFHVPDTVNHNMQQKWLPQSDFQLTEKMTRSIKHFIIPQKKKKKLYGEIHQLQLPINTLRKWYKKMTTFNDDHTLYAR